MRKIIHIVSTVVCVVEQLDNLELRGKPVIVVWQAKRLVVCEASYEARAFGLRPANAGGTGAERRCPLAVFVPPDLSQSCGFEGVHEIFKR